MKTALTLSAALLAVGSFALAHEGHEREHAAKQKETYALMAAAQGICPVTGMELDSMGGPIKAKSGEKTIFLCCKGCIGKPIKKDAWKQIQKNLAEAQGICPIMKKPLPKDATSTVVEGRTVFVCCKSCIEKVQTEPEKAFAVIDAQIKKHIEAGKTSESK